MSRKYKILGVLMVIMLGLTFYYNYRSRLLWSFLAAHGKNVNSIMIDLIEREKHPLLWKEHPGLNRILDQYGIDLPREYSLPVTVGDLPSPYGDGKADFHVRIVRKSDQRELIIVRMFYDDPEKYYHIINFVDLDVENF